MKLTLADIPKRISVKAIKTEGIFSYDIDNAYPQRMLRLIGASGTARNCVRLFSKFLSGKGFEDLSFAKTILNRKGETADKLLRKIADDYAQHGGFALHFNYNLNLKISEVSVIPMEHTRLPDQIDPLNINKIAVYDDWAKEFSSRIDRKKIKWIDRFTEDPLAVQRQIETAGGIGTWHGQVYWYSNEGESSYPVPVYDPVMEDIDTDSEVKITRNSNVRTGFSASHIFVHKGKFESEEKREEFIQMLSEFQGSDVANSIMLVETETEEQIPILLPIESNLSSKVIEITNTNIKNSIIEAFGQPQELFPGARGNGITFSNDALRLAYEYYNSSTEPDRFLIEEIFVKFMKLFEGNTFSNFALTPLQWAAGAEGETRLVETLGVGGTQALQTILTDPILTREQKMGALQVVFGISLEDSFKLLPATQL